MKKKVICLFSLILYFLLACTMLSQKIESEMMTQAKVYERENRGESFQFRESVLFSNEEDSYLYHVVNGTGWESGLRVREIPSALWRIGTYGGVEFSGSAQTYSFIYSASRQPKEGEEIAIVEEFTVGEDQYLYFWADGVLKEPVLPKNSEIAAQSEHALLLNLTEAEFPFFQHAAKALSDSTKTAQRVFSLTEAGQFLEELPKLAMVFALLLAGVVFWGCSCPLSIQAKTSRINRKIIWTNTMLAAVSLCLMGYVLNRIDLPASMLPTENVFDWKYYREEFSFLLDTLGKLGRTELSDAAAHEIRQSFWILGGSALCLTAVVCAECAVGLVGRRKVCRRRMVYRRKKIGYDRKKQAGRDREFGRRRNGRNR